MQSTQQQATPEPDVQRDCLFCRPDNKHPVLSNEHAYMSYDSYPVSPGHVLIIPHRHFDNYFDATPEETQALWDLVRESKAYLDEHHQPDAYNVGINIGRAAGQSVMHLHIHMIPRYQGDMENPQGGVRGVIPGKQKYTRRN